MTTAVLGERGIVADSWVHPDFKQYPAIKDALIQYPYDPRRAAAALNELGWRPGPDSVLQRGPGQRLAIPIRERENEKEAFIMADNWKAVGIEPVHEPFPIHLLRDRQARASFPGVDISSNPMGGLSAVRRFIGDAIPTPENRWTGTNRGGYSNPEWDTIGDRMRISLDESQRVALERDLVRIYTNELPSLPIYFEVQVVPVGGGLTGIQAIKGIAHTGHVMHTWNVHEWDVRG
jgi:peptide/nickel transport system substrate-binding protein